MDEDIHNLLQALQHDEDLAAAARHHMQEYRAFALARPRQEHVLVLKALLRTRLRALVEAARRDGKR